MVESLSHDLINDSSPRYVTCGAGCSGPGLGPPAPASRFELKPAQPSGGVRLGGSAPLMLYRSETSAFRLLAYELVAAKRPPKASIDTALAEPSAVPDRKFQDQGAHDLMRSAIECSGAGDHAGAFGLASAYPRLADVFAPVLAHADQPPGSRAVALERSAPHPIRRGLGLQAQPGSPLSSRCCSWWSWLRCLALFTLVHRTAAMFRRNGRACCCWRA